MEEYKPQSCQECVLFINSKREWCLFYADKRPVCKSGITREGWEKHCEKHGMLD